jgi:tRNA (guanine37-N1)-methyltransferase
MRVDIVTLFPDMFQALNYGITSRALEQGIIDLHYWNPRDYTLDAHRNVDDRPYGGGPGMVMKAQPIYAAVEAAKAACAKPAKVVLLSPQGKRLQQADIQAVVELTEKSRLILVAGRYEGVDERLVTTCIDEQWSIGDYILTGGELAAMILVDAMTRLLPGALGDEQSALQDSFGDGLLDCPHYTRPEIFAGLPVPSVLLSGNHAAIAEWRLQQALGRTWLYRRDLLNERKLTEYEQKLLDKFIKNQ